MIDESIKQFSFRLRNRLCFSRPLNWLSDTQLSRKGFNYRRSDFGLAHRKIVKKEFLLEDHKMLTKTLIIKINRERISTLSQRVFPLLSNALVNYARNLVRAYHKCPQTKGDSNISDYLPLEETSKAARSVLPEIFLKPSLLCLKYYAQIPH